MRLLREIVELCIATGASNKEIHDAVAIELKKFNERGERGDFLQEAADCQILLEVISHYILQLTGQSVDMAASDKITVLYKRDWEVDKDGVLWRPGTRR
jgi:hypothetical protein